MTDGRLRVLGTPVRAREDWSTRGKVEQLRDGEAKPVGVRLENGRLEWYALNAIEVKE